MSKMIKEEFERQVQNLLQKDYPKLAGIAEEEFLKLIRPLKEKLEGLNLAEIDLEKGYLPFVIVVKSKFVPTEKAMEGIVKLSPLSSEDFKPIESVNIPSSSVYLLLDIDRGKETLNVPPSEAFKMIQKQGRSPLTIDEGVAILTQYPQFLIKNNCFSLLASRAEDKRVPAIWINSKKQPNLGWCWDGNPHTWLGSASVKSRMGF